MNDQERRGLQMIAEAVANAARIPTLAEIERDELAARRTVGHDRPDPTLGADHVAPVADLAAHRARRQHPTHHQGA